MTADAKQRRRHRRRMAGRLAAHNPVERMDRRKTPPRPDRTTHDRRIGILPNAVVNRRQEKILRADATIAVHPACGGSPSANAGGNSHSPDPVARTYFPAMGALLQVGNCFIEQTYAAFTLWRPILVALTASGFIAPPAVGKQELDNVEFGINGTLAYDGECDDPRFRGPGMSSFATSFSVFQDATDCMNAYAKRKIWLSTPDTGDLEFGEDTLPNRSYDGYCDDPRFEGPGMAVSPDKDSIHRDAFDCERAYVLSKTIWLPWDSELFGNDSGDYAYDDECDDPRFENNPDSEKPGMAVSPDKESLGRDRNDCSSLLDGGNVRWREININEKFGNNSGVFSYDGECDDPRFENNPDSEEPGMNDTPSRDAAAKDALDCAEAVMAKRIRWVEVSDDRDEVRFGDNSGAFSYDGECDDPRFEDNPDSEEPGMASVLSWDDVAKDAFDCARAENEKRISKRDDWHPLHEAVIFGESDLVKKELDNGEKELVNRKTGDDGMFPIGLAALTNEGAEVIDLLIENGADQKLRDDGRELTALAMAARKDRSIDTLKTLLVDGDGARDGELTPLHILAAFTREPGKLDLFREHEMLSFAMKDGRTPLHVAAEHNETPQVVSKLIEIGLDVNAKDSDNETPLHRAVVGENAQAVEELLREGADPNIVRKKDDMSPLGVARFLKNRIICQMLSSATDPPC